MQLVAPNQMLRGNLAIQQCKTLNLSSSSDSKGKGVVRKCREVEHTKYHCPKEKLNVMSKQVG